MFMKTTLAAAALATAITAGTAALPSAAASAAPPQINFQIGFNTPSGYVQFGNGPGWGYHPKPTALTCGQAQNVLKSKFKMVSKLECNGPVYTFKTKKNFIGPWKTVQINKHTGKFWYV